MKTPIFKPGQVVYLQSDLKFQLPMTVKECEEKSVSVVWFDRNGKDIHNAFLPEMLKTEV